MTMPPATSVTATRWRRWYPIVIVAFLIVGVMTIRGLVFLVIEQQQDSLDLNDPAARSAFCRSEDEANANRKPAIEQLSDERISKLLIGRWSYNFDSGGAAHKRGVIHYKEDETFEVVEKYSVGGNVSDFTRSGSWTVFHGEILATVRQSSSHPHPYPVGSVEHTRLAAAIDGSLKLRDGMWLNPANEQGKE